MYFNLSFQKILAIKSWLVTLIWCTFHRNFYSKEFANHRYIFVKSNRFFFNKRFLQETFLKRTFVVEIEIFFKGVSVDNNAVFSKFLSAVSEKLSIRNLSNFFETAFLKQLFRISAGPLRSSDYLTDAQKMVFSRLPSKN